MFETILIVVGVLALLAITARKAASSGSSFPDPLEEPELPDPVTTDAETKSDRTQ